MKKTKSTKQTAVRGKLQRTTLKTSRLMEFCSRKELVNQFGHSVAEWPLVMVKELADNAVDACEGAGIVPEVNITVDEHGITVVDNGPGIPPETVEGIMDFSSRVSNKEAYVAPTRGVLGNALKTLVAMPFVLDGTEGKVEIQACGIRHEITMRVDQIRQEPLIDQQQVEDRNGKKGTTIRVYWPDSPWSEVEDKNDVFLQEDADDLDIPEDPEEYEILEEPEEGKIPDDWDWNDSEDEDLDSPTIQLDLDSPRSILLHSKSRFLQIAHDFTILNPHLSLTINWFGEQTVWKATNPEWQKWRPSDPTCPHWYTVELLGRLVAGYIAHDVDRHKDRTVRELVAEFRGLSSTAKQKRVLEETGLARMNLSALLKGLELDTEAIGKLLAAMQKHSKPVKPAALGLIGKAHLEKRFAEIGCEMKSFSYKKVTDETDGVPWAMETAFGWCPDLECRRLVSGVNWSPGVRNPFRQLGKYGDSLDAVLMSQRAGGGEPVILLLHIACPRVEYVDRGKTAIVIEEKNHGQ